MNAPQQRGGQAADALRELQQLASMYDHVAATEGKFVAGELRALATRLQIAESSAPPAPSVGGWMPIETAPKDGRKFLAWRRHSTLPLIVFYNADYYQYECSEGHLVFSLTHWQPLPQPPKEKP